MAEVRMWKEESEGAKVCKWVLVTLEKKWKKRNWGDLKVKVDTVGV